MRVETAKRTRKCSRSKAHAVRPGERLLLVREPGPAAGEKGYCADCAEEMLAAARTHLHDLHQGLRS